MKQIKSTKLLTGIILISTLTVCCIREDYGIEIFYTVFDNPTKYSIMMITYNDVELTRDTLFFEPSSKNQYLKSDLIYFNSKSDYVKILYGTKKQKIFQRFKENGNYFDSTTNSYYDPCKTASQIRNPFCTSYSFVDSYKTINEKEFHIFQTYTFTEEDYRNATPLVFGEVFVGSVWRCTEGAGLQDGLVYNELRFVSESQVEGWGQLEGEPEPELFFMATYSIDGETVIISEEGDRFTATLNETYTSLVTNIDNEGECIFIKQ